MVMSKSEAGKLGSIKLVQNLKAKYYGNPSKCTNCDKMLPYEKRHNKFCDRSCSASYNNRKREKHGNCCASCLKPLETRSRTYCSHKCENDFQMKERLEILLSDMNVEYHIRTIKSLLIVHYGHKCQSCGQSEWLNSQIPLEAHHIDGSADNNTFSNFSLLCPNCHALTDNYKGKNKNSTRNYRKKYY